MKTLIVLSSPAGAGKSTWAEHYQKTHPNVAIISSDDTKDELLAENEEYRAMDYKTLYPHVWKRVEEKISAHAFEGATTIMDATSIFNDRRLHYVKTHPEYDHFVLVLFLKSVETILAQNQKRRPERVVPEDAIRNMIRKMEMPDERIFETFDEIIEITESGEKHLKI